MDLVSIEKQNDFESHIETTKTGKSTEYRVPK